MLSIASLLGLQAFVVGSLILGAAPLAHAVPSLPSLECRFTDPQVVVLVDPLTGSGSVRRFAKAEVLLEGLALEEIGEGQLRVVLAEDLSEILVINLSREGSDGSSNLIYPFEGILTNGVDSKPSKSFGGCETSSMPARTAN